MALLCKHPDLAGTIDAAIDYCDEEALLNLADECLVRLETAEGIERVHLNYYKANCHGGISSIHSYDPSFAWSWGQPHGIAEVLALRRAIREPAFSKNSAIRVSQIRTNLANRLNSLGRPIAANEQWLKALDSTPYFAKALYNRAIGIREYSARLYDKNHQSILLAAARNQILGSLSDDAIWESNDRNNFVFLLQKQLADIESYLSQDGFREDYDLDQWELGESTEEVSYRRWCLDNRLFLNPLNDAYDVSVAATDVLHLPNHTYGIDETLRFPAYFNLLKQEYVSARYRLYRALHLDEPEYIMKDVLLLSSGEGQVLGHHTEELRSAFRGAYSIFDKIALFLSDYFQLGHKTSQVSFVGMWYSKARNSSSGLHSSFQDRQNWPLRGLYFLSFDLNDDQFKNVAEPDSVDLAKLRNQAEHRFLSFQYLDNGESTETHEQIGVDDFQRKTLRMLKLAREAIVYVSLAMHIEEETRTRANEDPEKLSMPIFSRPIKFFGRF